MEYLRKILKILDYFIVKFESISSFKVLRFQENRREFLRKFEKNYGIPKKKIGERLRKCLGNFSLNLRKICRKSVDSQN